MKKAVSWIHDGDLDPTHYESQVDLAKRLGVAKSTIRNYVDKGISSDAERQAINRLHGCVTKPYRAIPFDYEGVHYESLQDYCDRNRVGRKKALLALEASGAELPTRERKPTGSYGKALEKAMLLAQKAVGKKG